MRRAPRSIGRFASFVVAARLRRYLAARSMLRAGSLRGVAALSIGLGTAAIALPSGAGAYTNAGGSYGVTATNQASGLVMDVYGGWADNGTTVDLWYDKRNAPGSYLANQKFDFIRWGNTDYFWIRAENSGKCLDVWGASPDDGAPVTTFTCVNQDNQLWSFAGNGVYKLVSKSSGKCLDAANWYYPDPPQMGASLQQWTCAEWQDGGAWQDPWSVDQDWVFSEVPLYTF
jgi:hypothetical protein